MNTVISIILFLIILIALYQMYYYVNPKLLVDESILQLNMPTDKTTNASSQVSVMINDDDEPASVRYFYDGWLRVNQVQNNDKNLIIFNQGYKFVVSLKGHVLSINELTDDIKITTTDGTWVDSSATTITTISPNFPFQKWTYFCINVEGNQMDTYLDGKLVTSVKGKDVDKKSGPSGAKLDFTTYVSANNKTIKVGNKYTTGSLARFRRESGNMDPQSVWNTYMLGPGVNDSGDDNNPDYHAKIRIHRNGIPKRTFNLF
jgi:hypothetical protein